MSDRISIYAIGSNVARDVVETLRKCTHGEGKDWFAFDSMNMGLRERYEDDVRQREMLKKIRTDQPSREIRNVPYPTPCSWRLKLQASCNRACSRVVQAGLCSGS